MGDNSKSAGTIFITGIPVSGKSTLGKKLEEYLLKCGINNVKLLDGEEIRKELAIEGKRYGYSTDDRNKVALEIARYAAQYNREGVICIICSICHVKEIRRQMRSIIGSVMEVYLDCPVSICAQRDYKGYYARAFQGLNGNFIGVTEPYQKSEHAELVLNTGANSVEECSRILFESVITFLKTEETISEKY